MYAVARLNTYDPDKLAAAGESLQRFDQLHAAQPGFLGSLAVDLEDGRRLLLNLWESREHSAAGLSVLGPEVHRVLNPLKLGPSQLLGTGPVLSADLGRIPRPIR